MIHLHFHDALHCLVRIHVFLHTTDRVYGRLEVSALEQALVFEVLTPHRVAVATRVT